MVSEAVIDGFSNSNYSYSRLAEKMKKPVSNKDCSSNIFFQLFDRKGNNLKLDGLKVDFISWDSEVNSFDLKCMVFEQNEEIIIKFSYNRNLFNRSTIKDWLKQYYILLEKIKCCPTKKINELF